MIVRSSSGRISPVRASRASGCSARYAVPLARSSASPIAPSFPCGLPVKRIPADNSGSLPRAPASLFHWDSSSTNHASSGEDVLHLVREAGRIDRNGDDSAEDAGDVGKRPFHPRGGEDRHLLSPGDPQAHQAARHFPRGRPDLPVGHWLPRSVPRDEVADGVTPLVDPVQEHPVDRRFLHVPQVLPEKRQYIVVGHHPPGGCTDRTASKSSAPLVVSTLLKGSKLLVFAKPLDFGGNGDQKAIAGGCSLLVVSRRGRMHGRKLKYG
jgi:hypothetical protein